MKIKNNYKKIETQFLLLGLKGTKLLCQIAIKVSKC